MGQECKHANTKCVDSREYVAQVYGYSYIKKRRRECLDCGYRFTTLEMTIEQVAQAGNIKAKKILEIIEKELNHL